MEEESKIPNIYFDTMRVTVTLWGVNMTFALNPPHPHEKPETLKEPEPSVVARTSLNHAKVFAMLLRKQLKHYEKDNAEIFLPKEMYENLGLNPDEW